MTTPKRPGSGGFAARMRTIVLGERAGIADETLRLAAEIYAPGLVKSPSAGLAAMMNDTAVTATTAASKTRHDTTVGSYMASSSVAEIRKSKLKESWRRTTADGVDLWMQKLQKARASSIEDSRTKDVDAMQIKGVVTRLGGLFEDDFYKFAKEKHWYEKESFLTPITLKQPQLDSSKS